MSAGWHMGRLMAWDTETTGVDPLQARIVTATVIDLIPGQKPRPWTWLVNPGVEIPDEAAAIHGVTTEHAQAEGVEPAVALEQMVKAIASALRDGIPVIAMNANYDVTVLHSECVRHGVDPVPSWRPVIDPLTIDRAVDKYRKGPRNLQALCDHYDVRLDGAHDATQDALATARVAWRIANTYPHIARMDLNELHDAQADWYAVWATHFQEYLRRRGGQPDAVIDTSWPLRRSEVAA